jgi:CubicO group peptidase (beta-lactamase class C family)
MPKALRPICAGIALAVAMTSTSALAAPRKTADPLDVTLEIASGRFSGVLAAGRPGEAAVVRSHVHGTTASGWSTAYPLASVTKVFTATAILALHEQGQLDLDAALESLLPHYASLPAAGVTVRQLLAHTSGIPSVMQTGQGLDATLDPATFPLPSSLDEQLAPVRALPLLFEPGSRYAYSNSGYLVLGEILEHVTGHTFDDAILSLALAPAGLVDEACFCVDLPGAPDAAAEEWKGDGIAPAIQVHPSRSLTAGGMKMTPRALMAWTQALAAGRILKPETLAMAWTPGQSTRRKGESMGLGWLVREDSGKKLVLHDGALPGATATVAIDTDTGNVAIGVLSPTLPLEHLSLSEDYLRERVVALAKHQRPNDLPAGPATPAAAPIGDYRLPDGRTLTVAPRGEALTVSLSGDTSPLEIRQAVRWTTPLAESAVQAAEALVRKGQDALGPYLADNLKAELPPKALDGFVDGWKAQHGEFQAAHVFAINPSGTSTHLRFQFERGAIDIGFNYSDGKIDGLQLLGESRRELPTTLTAWTTADGSLWMDGYRHASAPVELFPLTKEGRVEGLSLDRDASQPAAFPRVP